MIPFEILLAGDPNAENDIKILDFSRILKEWERKNKFIKPESKITAKYDHGRAELTNSIIRYARRYVERGDASAVVRKNDNSEIGKDVEDLTDQYIQDML